MTTPDYVVLSNMVTYRESFRNTMVIILQGGGVTILKIIVDLTQLESEKSNNFDVSLFQGLPYAVPPQGKLRWHAPVAMTTAQEAWPQVFEATDFGNKCMQYDVYTNTTVGKSLRTLKLKIGQNNVHIYLYMAYAYSFLVAA